MDLELEPDALNACVQCGLCLPHCPTYRVTGDELLSPRGRIQLMRELQDHGAPLTDDVVHSFETCVQCRGCEPACPSQVPFGQLIEQTRASLVREGVSTPRWQRAALWFLGRPRLLAIGTSALAVLQRVRLLPRRLGIGITLPVTRRPIPTTGDDILLFTGCVMDTMQRDVHIAAAEVLTAAQFGVTPTGSMAPCCGALHSHAGLDGTARAHAERTIAALGSDRPIVVDSAGCGAALKDYGRMLGTEAAATFSAQVFDIFEFLVPHLETLPDVEALDLRVAVQDPCHLRHVQKQHEATRTVLDSFVTDVVEIADDGLCCGAGGSYSMTQPDLARSIRDRKLAEIAPLQADVVASANPGCAMHLAAGGASTVHPIQLVHRALTGASDSKKQ